MSNIIPVITLKQPWVSWVMKGLKLKESRIHTNFKTLEGKTFGIHSAMDYDKSDYVVKNPYLTQVQIDASFSYPTGVILGTVHCDKFLELNGDRHEQEALIECRSIKRYGLNLITPKPFEKEIPCKGELAIWYFDLETMEKVRKPKQEIPTFF